jgi:HD-GYP domain-containing protein (c-di-GMP phosphodiesterase class II)
MTLKDMMPIAIEDFITALALPVDVFVRLSDDKLVLVCKAGTRASRSQLESYQSKDLLQVWVRKTDYHLLSQQSITIAGFAVKKGDLQVSQKTAVLTAAAKTVFKQFDNIGVTAGSYTDARLITEATVTFVESHVRLAAIFDSLRQFSDELLTHAMAVSVLSAVLGSNMGWTKRHTLEKLALGGLLHDIGLKSLPADLLAKPRIQMTPEEVALYETHPFRGMELVSSLGIVPDDVVAIVYEHHENAMGQGYPQRMRDIKAHPLARVIGVANQFCELVFPNVNTPNVKNMREAVQHMEFTMGLPFNREVFRALKKIVDEPSVKKVS